MKLFNILSASLFGALLASCAETPVTVGGYDDALTYIGRVDRTDSLGPRQWGAATYFTFAFDGSGADIDIADQRMYGTNYNYLEVIVDGDSVGRVATGASLNRLIIGKPQLPAADSLCHVMHVADSLVAGPHTVLVCRDTECGMGYTEVLSVTAPGLSKWKPEAKHRIEFLGNSITSGMEMYDGVMPFGEGTWFDHHRGYYAYGPRTARNLNAEWSMASVSGIGLIHSCCEHKYVLPQTYDKVNLVDNEIPYDFSFDPDLVVSALGQNDGVQDSTSFVDAYVDLLRVLHEKNPNADLAVISSPMADDTLRTFFRTMLPAIVAVAESRGYYGKNQKVPFHIFEKSYTSGGAQHPNMAEQKEISDEVTAFLKQEFGF